MSGLSNENEPFGLPQIQNEDTSLESAMHTTSVSNATIREATSQRVTSTDHQEASPDIAEASNGAQTTDVATTYRIAEPGDAYDAQLPQFRPRHTGNNIVDEAVTDQPDSDTEYASSDAADVESLLDSSTVLVDRHRVMLTRHRSVQNGYLVIWTIYEVTERRVDRLS